jgi:hypothetical protein
LVPGNGAPSGAQCPGCGMTDSPHFGDCEFAELSIHAAQLAGGARRQERADPDAPDGTATGSALAGRVKRLLRGKPG